MKLLTLVVSEILKKKNDFVTAVAAERHCGLTTLVELGSPKQKLKETPMKRIIMQKQCEKTKIFNRPLT